MTRKHKASKPQTDEAFVKQHFPNARTFCYINGKFDIMYRQAPGPNNRSRCKGIHDTKESAWAQAAKEVREYLAKAPEPASPAMTPERMREVLDDSLASVGDLRAAGAMALAEIDRMKAEIVKLKRNTMKYGPLRKIIPKRAK